MTVTDRSAAAVRSDRFVPRPTPQTQPYWDAAREGRLSIQRCEACGRPFFYPRSSCPRCGSQDLTWITCSGRATLHSFVISTRPAPGFEPPTVIAVVELDEGPRMMTNVVGVDPEPENLPLDLPLHVAFEDRGELVVPVFEPVDRGSR